MVDDVEELRETRRKEGGEGTKRNGKRRSKGMDEGKKKRGRRETEKGGEQGR